jgi:hypothetical protein
MKAPAALTTLCAALLFAQTAHAASTGSPFYGDPPDEHHPWAIHDQNRPQPKIVTPGTSSTQEQPGKPPSDAIILFDGTEATLAKWEADKKESGVVPQWIVKDGAMQCKPGSGYIRTKDKFGDGQYHIEWAAPSKVDGSSQGRGNSGIFLEGVVEVQVLDNYNNPTYADGMAGSIYGTNPPAANALRPPGEFQFVDIIFRRPVYKDGKPLDPGYVTVFINGVLVQDHTPLEGGGGHMGRSKPGPFPDKGPLTFQDHGNPVRFRNVWFRELPLRSCEGGTDGYLSTEAALAKRKETAASIREDAAKLRDANNPLNELLRLAESLYYEKDEPTFKKVEEGFTQYAAGIKQLAAEKLTSKKDEVKRVAGVLKYLSERAAIFPKDFAPRTDLDKIVKDQGWDKK